jgi:DNA polymerase III subunit beta
MKLVIGKDKLLDGVQAAYKAAVKKTMSKEDDSILINVQEDGIETSGNCLDYGIVYSTKDVDITETGAVVVNGKILQDIAKKMDGEISLITDGSRLILISGTTKADLPTQKLESFPVVDDETTDDQMVLEISHKIFKDLILKTSFAARKDMIYDSRPYLSSILFNMAGREIDAVALDGVRFALRINDVGEIKKSNKFLVRSKTLDVAARLFADDDLIKICHKNQKIDENGYSSETVFKTDKITLVDHSTVGEFVDYKKLLSQFDNYKDIAIVDVNKLKKSLEKSIIFSAENVPVVMDFSTDKINVTYKSVVGYLDDNIEVDYNGTHTENCFNPLLLIDALKSIDEDNILIKINGTGPILITSDSGKFKHIISPVIYNN